MGVVKEFGATGRLFPQRKWGGAWDGQIKWGKLTHSRVLQAVKNPVYAGAYAYGRSYDARTVRPDGTVAAIRVKRARAEWTVLIQDHHPGYITWEQFLDIARTLEGKWEAKLTALADAEGALATARAARPPLPERDVLLALAADLPRLWHHPDTPVRDRKRLLRTLIADVTMLPEQHKDEVRFGVRWHTGATDEITAGRIGPGRTPPAALELIRRHGATHTSEQLAGILNEAGLRTGRGHRWCKDGVARVRDAYTIHGPRTVAVQDGEVSVKQAAAELGIPADAIYNWLSHGQVPARRGPSGRWCIPWDPDTQGLYRRKVAASFRLKPTQPTAGQ